MCLDRLMWLCGGLFVAFGLCGLAFVEARGWQNVWGGLSVLSLAGFGLAMAGDGIVKGQITVHFSVIQRASQPRTFWASVVLVAAASAGVVVSGLWVLFFKPW